MPHEVSKTRLEIESSFRYPICVAPTASQRGRCLDQIPDFFGPGWIGFIRSQHFSVSINGEVRKHSGLGGFLERKCYKVYSTSACAQTHTHAHAPMPWANMSLWGCWHMPEVCWFKASAFPSSQCFIVEYDARCCGAFVKYSLSDKGSFFLFLVCWGFSSQRSVELCLTFLLHLSRWPSDCTFS